MYVSNVTRRHGRLSSISVADPDGRSASFAIEGREVGELLAHTPGVAAPWRREARAYANAMLATELKATARPPPR
ncbi:MAG: hypothetical protein QXG03_00575 [Halalkalicoccus sp.]